MCSRIKAYQWCGTDAFWSYHQGRWTTIDGAYVDGVSVTHGSPRHTSGHLQLGSQRVIQSTPMSVHVMPVEIYRSHHLWVKTTSVSQE